jgi:hypothetical protein
MIRKLLDSETYTNRVNPMHSGHCIEQMRQYIMCAGDLTPIPTKYYKGIGGPYVISDQTHTCRNFDQMRQWVTDRQAQNNVTRSTCYDDGGICGEQI